MQDKNQTVMTVDGNTAAAYVAYAFTETATIYPITPSSTMAELVEEWSVSGRKNIYGQPVKVVQMQSEAGAAGAFHGALQGGTLATTFTASQGLLLMIPNLYKIAGELLPGVIHVSARALAAQALNIFGDHQDVMAVRQTGCVMLASSSVQEVADFAAVAHMATVLMRLPVIHFFDGFRTSHEINKIKVLSYETYGKLIDRFAVREFRRRALSPMHPVIRGTAQNPDIYFQTREASNLFYEKAVDIVEEAMKRLEVYTGRHYEVFSYYGSPQAKYVLVAMGSVCETIKETIAALEQQGEQVGLVQVHVYRPFCAKRFLKALPSSVEKIAVLDRTKEPGANGEPLYLDVCEALHTVRGDISVIGGRFGLGLKDTTPQQIAAVYKNLKQENSKEKFTIGITDDVTHLSLENENVHLPEKDMVECKCFGLGSDGTVGANKQAIKIIGEHTPYYVQGYFAYDSKKSGGLTTSHLRFGKHPIRSEYLITQADYIACHNASFLNGGRDLLAGIKPQGIFVLNISQKEDVGHMLPAQIKRTLAQKKIRFYTIDAVAIAKEIGLGNRINMIMQGVFFKLTGILSEEEAKKYIKQSLRAAYEKKGETVVAMNERAVDEGFLRVKKVEFPKTWEMATDEKKETITEPEFITRVMRPMERGEGDSLKVSAWKGMEDGSFPSGVSAYEKRGIAIHIPAWIKENCIQCNQCSFVCPHGCIRPYLSTKEECKEAPKSYETIPAVGKGLEHYGFRIQVSPMDCTGCGNCADVCPAAEKALVMEPMETQAEMEVGNYAFAEETLTIKNGIFPKTNVKMSQFVKPLLAFSGACAGCGETPYIKLATQLFGSRMMIANATGCSSIWAASAPATAYMVDEKGHGPAWANSLFEDNAEFGYGMYLSGEVLRMRLLERVRKLLFANLDTDLRQVLEMWLKDPNNEELSVMAYEKVTGALCHVPATVTALPEFQEVRDLSEYFIKRSQWIVGGDGWAYDIGFSGLDHVLSTGADVNVLVFDTEVYSNTGGQVSKATPFGAHAKFAAMGKYHPKKQLAKMMMTYGNVYVAQVAMGADKNQTLQAFLEAQRYHGPSLIIAYAPCINHGIKEGMGRSMENMKLAVETGHVTLFRYNPDLKKEGKQPLIVDSKEPSKEYKEFLSGQIRFQPLRSQSEEEVQQIYEQAQEQVRKNYASYQMCAKEQKESAKYDFANG